MSTRTLRPSALKKVWNAAAMCSGCDAMPFEPAAVPFHAPDHRRVEADAGAEEERAVVGHADAHPFDGVVLERAEQAHGPRRRPHGGIAERLRSTRSWSRPGSGASTVSVCSSPVAASFSVPSPAYTATTSNGRAVAARARSMAWPRRDVSATSTSCSAARMLRMALRLRGVTDDAVGLTSRSTRTGRGGYRSSSIATDRPRTLHSAWWWFDRVISTRLHREISGCDACPRLVEWREQVGREKRAAFRDERVLGPAGAGFR